MNPDEKIAKLEKEVLALKRKIKGIEDRMTIAARMIETVNYLHSQPPKDIKAE